MANLKLGELLVRANVLTEHQLRMALAEQQRWGGKLGDILVRMRLLTEELLVKALSKQLGLQATNVALIQDVPLQVLGKVPEHTAHDLRVLPLELKDEGKTLVVAMADPLNVQHLDALRSVSRCRIIPRLAGPTALVAAVERFYRGEVEIGEPDESSFKVLDSQDRTVIRGVPVEPEPPPPRPQARPALESPFPPPRVAPPPPSPPAPVAQASKEAGSPAETLKALEDAQNKEVAVLKAMVELMIEKGVFTREEYLAKVKR